MKEDVIRVVICEPGKAAYGKEIRSDGKTIREILGGSIESHHPFWPEKAEDSSTMLILCNEGGKILELPCCRALTDDDGFVYDIVHGTFIICAANRQSGCFCSLSPIQEEIAMQTFGKPEMVFEDSDAGVVLVFPHFA